MKRHSQSYTINDSAHLKKQLLHWAQQFREVVFLDSNNYQDRYGSYEAVLAVDAFTSLQTDDQKAFLELQSYQQETNDWLFGYLSYDLKNSIEPIDSQNIDGLNFPDLFFFQPKKIIILAQETLRFEYLGICEEEIADDFHTISTLNETKFKQFSALNIQDRVSFKEYVKGFDQMKCHIQRGDIYEANYCMEFYADQATIDPLETYWKLNSISEPPFACFGKFNQQYVLCASPERYLKKQGTKIISQPIKGTSKRGANLEEDLLLKKQLRENPKEQSENVMIVDLVRNDLSKTAIKASVKVEELFGIYTFKQVHQMISTVVSEVAENQNPVNIIQSTFPMGSMTGAPKLSAMKIIEEVEQSKRGLYSGAIGYFTPDNDFDFNVVIRSILYNQKNNYLSFSVGSAITINANAEDEYNECLLKAQAMKKVLTHAD
ncbi:MAG: anthranilate synthase component I family protein [Myroides sp.]|nr:anthranilate synthase component I family protein [Myroides sp.]